jgi:hypothetical protein
LTARLARTLLIAGASLVIIGLVGRFGFDGGGDAAAPRPSPSPATSPAPSPEPTGSVEASASQTPSPEPAETTVPETPEEFFALFAEAIRTGDVEFLLDRLHPVVLDLYGRQQCRAAVASLPTDPSFGVRVRSVRGPESYEFAPDGQSVTVDDAFTLTLAFTSTEGTSRQEGHLALIDGEMRWFTDCGDPLT